MHSFHLLLSILGFIRIVADECLEMKNTYSVEVGSSWGNLPPALQAKWEQLRCNEAFYVVGDVKYYGSKYATKKNQKAESNPNFRCKLLLYDRTNGYLNWNQKWFQSSVNERCLYPCEITEDKGEANSADIIVYHAPTHQKMQIAQNTKKGAIHLMVCLEQPKYAPLIEDVSYLKSHFDAMMTYSLQKTYHTIPHLPATYYPLELYSPFDVIQAPSRSFHQKNGFGTNVSVAVFTSNCGNAGATSRAEYIKELMKYIPIHSYGKCHNNVQEPNIPYDPAIPAFNQRKAKKISILKNYKFYLAFENSPVQDYVSEKVFDGLLAGALPVYRGTDNIGRFMPSKQAFIDANRMSPMELGSYLQFLNENEYEYNKYMDYRGSDKKLLKAFRFMTLRSYTHPNVICRLGDYLHSGGRRSSAQNSSSSS